MHEFFMISHTSKEGENDRTVLIEADREWYYELTHRQNDVMKSMTDVNTLAQGLSDKVWRI